MMRTTIALATLLAAPLVTATGQAPYVRGSAFGAEVVVKPGRGADPSATIRGELLAVSADSLWILGPTDLSGIALTDVRGVQMRRFRSGASAALLWGLAGGLISGGLLTAACSSVDDASGCGGVLVASLILWGLWGGIGAATLESSSKQTLPPAEGALRGYARFPQGWPPDIDRSVFRIGVTARLP